MDAVPERPARRRRYSGPNPRNFEDKYKEHQSDRYAEDVSRVVDRGQTPAGMHRPIMVAEILAALQLVPGNTVVDCTLGYGGHARELLAAVLPGGRLLGVDADPIELPKTAARLRALAPVGATIDVRRMNFAGIAGFLAIEASQGVDALLVDLGVSSMQLDDPTRGFSFKVDGPLDMRMNPRSGLSASDLLSTLDNVQLSAILVENADEPNADELSQRILTAHRRSPLLTTFALVEVVRLASKSQSDAESNVTVRRVFQSLRIAVNQELRSLDAFLRQLPSFMKKGGRVAILTFHSGEDRRVKSSFNEGLREGLYDMVSKEVIRASPAEQRSNGRSSSAKLRIAVRS